MALDSGLSVSLSAAALRCIGLKNRLALQLYYLVASKRAGKRAVEISSDVLEQVVRPTESWRRKLRARTEAACRLINAADPAWHLSVVNDGAGAWKVLGGPPPPRR